jgi:hypothetical protein
MAKYTKRCKVWFGLRMRIVRMKLGSETLELTQYLAPEGRPIPAGWRSNDHSFQHAAIVASDMDKAYQHLRAHKVRHASTGPQTLPLTNKAAAGIRAFYFKDPDGHNLEIIYFPDGKGRSALAEKPRSHVLRNRPYGDRRFRYAITLKLLSRSVGFEICRREHKLRHRAGAFEQRSRRALAHYLEVG